MLTSVFIYVQPIIVHQRANKCKELLRLRLYEACVLSSVGMYMMIIIPFQEDLEDSLTSSSPL